MAQLLEIASYGNVSKTALVYRANLNFTLVQKYLDHLENKGMISHSNGGSRATYSLTQKGWETLFSAKKAVYEMLGEGPVPAELVQFPS